MIALSLHGKIDLFAQQKRTWKTRREKGFGRMLPFAREILQTRRLSALIANSAAYAEAAEKDSLWQKILC
jgi:hypothetical protein